MAVSWDIIQVPGTLLLQIHHLLIKILYLHRHGILRATTLSLESGQFIFRFSSYVRAQRVSGKKLGFLVMEISQGYTRMTKTILTARQRTNTIRK